MAGARERAAEGTCGVESPCVAKDRAKERGECLGSHFCYLRRVGSFFLREECRLLYWRGVVAFGVESF